MHCGSGFLPETVCKSNKFSVKNKKRKIFSTFNMKNCTFAMHKRKTNETLGYNFLSVATVRLHLCRLARLAYSSTDNRVENARHRGDGGLFCAVHP